METKRYVSVLRPLSNAYPLTLESKKPASLLSTYIYCRHIASMLPEWERLEESHEGVIKMKVYVQLEIWTIYNSVKQKLWNSFIEVCKNVIQEINRNFHLIVLIIIDLSNINCKTHITTNYFNVTLHMWGPTMRWVLCQKSFNFTFSQIWNFRHKLKK